ncbi:hypothetical protein MKY34_13060 [Sporosarcina sp. FSL K6-1522]|uniref:hypothetical protein n=1 Tax=Sporosarcina sp. FSL K6-1522 TaxID=2921554 RepID=UPI00315A69BF
MATTDYFGSRIACSEIRCFWYIQTICLIKIMKLTAKLIHLDYPTGVPTVLATVVAPTSV